MGPKQQIVQGLFEKREGRDARLLLSIDLIKNILSSFKPELLKETEESLHLLEEIDDYLFVKPGVNSRNLRKIIDEDFYTALYGLKSLLKKCNGNINIVSWCIEEKSRHFESWLDKELNDWKIQPN